MAERKMPRKTSEVALEVTALLALPLADAELREQLEKLAAAELAFGGLTHLWGPAYTRRNPVLFRPLILSQFRSWEWAGGWRPPVAWRAARWRDSRRGARRRTSGRRRAHFDALITWELTPPGKWQIDAAGVRQRPMKRWTAATTLNTTARGKFRDIRQLTQR